MHEDTRLALVALGIGLFIVAVYAAVGRPLMADAHLLAGVLIGVMTFLGLKHWGRRRTGRSGQLEEIRELATTEDLVEEDYTSDRESARRGRVRQPDRVRRDRS